MITTKEEAKTKWCPMVTFYALPGNWFRFFIKKLTSWTSTRGNTGRHCIASDCAIWRWSDPPTKFKVDVPAYETKGDPIGHDIPFPNRRGYCGLGGKP